jgi:hypothetical protein
MSGTMRRDEASDRRASSTARHTAAPAPADGHDSGRSVAHASDPRLAHAGGAVGGLLALQRSAGNAAVSAMIGGEVPVQRAVEIDEIDVSTPDPAADAADTPDPAGATGAAGATGSGGAVTSDGGTTTITGGVVNIDGGQVNLNAAMTHASGVLQADTLIANSVVASSYTPGAGNVW